MSGDGLVRLTKELLYGVIDEALAGRLRGKIEHAPEERDVPPPTPQPTFSPPPKPKRVERGCTDGNHDGRCGGCGCWCHRERLT